MLDVGLVVSADVDEAVCTVVEMSVCSDGTVLVGECPSVM